jgi:hypothetical protein
MWRDEESHLFLSLHRRRGGVRGKGGESDLNKCVHMEGMARTDVLTYWRKHEETMKFKRERWIALDYTEKKVQVHRYPFDISLQMGCNFFFTPFSPNSGGM